MQAALGCRLPMTVVPASLLLREEPCRPFRFWSYLVTSLLWRTGFKALPKCETLITASDYFCDIVPALALKRRTGAKWIAWIHHCETDPGKRPGNRLVNELTYRMQRWSFKRIARYADAAWINDTLAGDEIEARLLRFGMRKDRIRRMWNGIDCEVIAATPEPGGKSFDAVMIGVRPNKGLFDIAPIWRRVQELRPGTTLALMGGMSGEADEVRRIAEAKLPVSVFKPEGGFLPAAEYYARMKGARILFAPSHEEGWGIAVCEAMAAGLPVVAYDLPAYRKIFTGAYCAVPCFDHEGFAQAVVRMLDDKNLADGFRSRGRVISAKYGWNAIAVADSAALEALE